MSDTTPLEKRVAAALDAGNDPYRDDVAALLDVLVLARDRADGWQRQCEETQQERNAAMLRAEQAERERDEARHAVLRRFNEANEEKAARERAEADNAALLESYRRTWGCVMHDNVVHSPACNASPQGECTPSCPARVASTLLASGHPGAALLEESERRRQLLEDVAKACRGLGPVTPEIEAVVGRVLERLRALEERATMLDRVHPGAVEMLREHPGHTFNWKVRCITCAPTSREKRRANAMKERKP